MNRIRQHKAVLASATLALWLFGLGSPLAACLHRADGHADAPVAAVQHDHHDHGAPGTPADDCCEVQVQAAPHCEFEAAPAVGRQALADPDHPPELDRAGPPPGATLHRGPPPRRPDRLYATPPGVLFPALFDRTRVLRI